MNKKGQMDMPRPEGGFGAAHPILVLGIVVFVVPYLAMVIQWNVPKWISGIGVVLIIIGAILSAMRN